MKDIQMKIVTLGTLTNKMNGSARSFYRLAGLLSRNHVLIPIVPDVEGIGAQLTESNPLTIVVPYVPVRRSLKNLIRVPFDILKIKKIISEIQPDIIHVNDIPWFYTIYICKTLKIPSIIHSRYFEKNAFVRKIIKIALKKYDGIIYVSHYNKMLWNIPDKGKNFVLHNPGVFKYIFKEALLENIVKPYMLIVSRISEEKGILEAIKTFSDLCRYDDETKLVIAGDVQLQVQSDYLQACKQYISSSDLDARVVWLGKVDYPHILYKHASCYLHLPNFDDPFPTTIMEALSIGCRIITREKGGIPEQVKGFDGILLVNPQIDNGREIHDFLHTTPMYVDRQKKYVDRFDEECFLSEFEKIITRVCKK